MVLHVETWTIPTFLKNEDDPGEGEYVEIRWMRWVEGVDTQDRPLGLIRITVDSWGF